MVTKGVNTCVIIKIITVILVVSVAAQMIVGYYNKVLDEKDRLEAKRIQNVISLIVAKYEGGNLTYKSGRIFWTNKNADIIKDGIIENLALSERKVPEPSEDGYYYYMYLEAPYTVIKLPYKIEGLGYIDTGIVTKEYISEKYPKKEYVQVDGKVPYAQITYSEDYSYYVDISEYEKNVVVCLN